MKPSPSSSLPLAPQPAAAKASTERMPATDGMHKTARDYALKYRAPLGMYGAGHGAREGHYYLTDGRGHYALSMEPTAQSAITMMRKHGFKPADKFKLRAELSKHCGDFRSEDHPELS